jgi:hypothetical protein
VLSSGRLWAVDLVIGGDTSSVLPPTGGASSTEWQVSHRRFPKTNGEAIDRERPAEHDPRADSRNALPAVEVLPLRGGERAARSPWTVRNETRGRPPRASAGQRDRRKTKLPSCPVPPHRAEGSRDDQRSAESLVVGAIAFSDITRSETNRHGANGDEPTSSAPSFTSTRSSLELAGRDFGTDNFVAPDRTTQQSRCNRRLRPPSFLG